MSIQFGIKEMEKIFEEVGESGLVDLAIGEELIPVIFRNPQYHPLVGNLIHVDCYKVNLKEKIITTVPVEIIGESLAVKAGNVLVEVTNEIEVEALPADLPERVEVDISVLDEVGKMITVADLKLGKGVEAKTHHEQVIVKVEEPKEEVVETPETAVAPGDVPATEQKTPEELAAAEAESKKAESKKE